MEKQNHAAGSMIELIIAVFVFVLVSVSCVGLFVQSRVRTLDSALTTWAADEALDVSEILRASNSEEEFFILLQEAFPQANVSGQSAELFVDANINACTNEENSRACMTVQLRGAEDGCLQAEISATDIKDGDLLYEVTAKHYID